MTVGEGRDLRQVRDAQDLMEARQLFQLAADDLGNGAADARVHLVENHRGDAAALRLETLEREHHAREFAARRDS